MGSKKTFLVISEKRERLTIRRTSRKVIHSEFCRNCRKRVGWLTLEEASQLSNTPSAELAEKVHRGDLDHLVVGASRFLICSNSLFRSA